MSTVKPVDRTSTTHTEPRTYCDHFLACLNQVKQWACSFFQWLFCCSRAEPIKPIPATRVLESTSKNKSTITQEAERPIQPILPTKVLDLTNTDVADWAELLTQDFLNKKKTHNSSGYRVNIHLEMNSKLDASTFPIEIEPKGTKNSNSIPMPTISADESAKRFALTRQKATPFCEELTKHIAPYNMFAIFSHSNNLLLIPDTKKGLKAAEYPHLFALNETQLRDVFSAALAAHYFLESRYPDYGPHIGAHVGYDGNQREGLLHVRFEHLPPQITALNKSS